VSDRMVSIESDTEEKENYDACDLWQARRSDDGRTEEQPVVFLAD
jgi:hypothetical protein